MVADAVFPKTKEVSDEPCVQEGEKKSDDDGANGYDNEWFWNGMIKKECVDMATEEHKRKDLCRKNFDEWCDCSKCMNNVEQAIEDSRNNHVPHN